MAVRAARASTNFTTATTWATVDATSYLAAENGVTTLSTTESLNRAASGSTTGAITIDGVGLRLNQRIGTTGTFSVQLYNLTDTAVVAGTLVTINVSDMPAIAGLADGGWMFFKFSAPVTLTAAKAYVISPVTSSASQVSLCRDSTASNWSRYLRTTTTGAPAAGDDLIIAGEWTAAATVATLTVTMDQTAATDYGSAPTAANGLLSPGIAIGEHGVLRYNDASAGNPYLRLSNSLIVYNGGIFDMASTLAVTMTIASPGVVTWTAHGFEVNRKITLRTTGALPTGLSNGVDYYVRNPATNTFELALTPGGASIVTTGSQSGTHTAVTGIPRNSTAILEFDCAADGDYALIERNGAIVNKQGLSRTSGKNVVAARMTVDSQVNLMATITPAVTAVTAVALPTVLDPTGTSLGGTSSTPSTFNILLGYSDTVANSNHKLSWSGAASVTNVTQVFTQWIKRGSGTNNRFVRLQLGATTALPTTNGFYADFDLLTPSAGTCTALGTGTATSASITAFGGGFICTIIGKVSSALGPFVATVGTCNASGVVSYAGDATQNFITNWPQVYTLSAQPTQDTIDTDTGWLSGDVVGLASTTRTTGECEVASLNGNAGASTLTYNLYPVNARSGSGDVPNTVTLTIASPCVVTGNKDAVNGAKVVLTTTGALPTGLTASTSYYVVNKIAGGTHQLAATPGGAAINTSGSQSGVHTATVSCTQAEVILVNRNVKIRSTNPTLMTYVSIKSGAVVDIDWAEFYYIGTGSATQAGGVDVEVNSTAVTNFSMQFSSIHDTEQQGFKVSVNASGTLTSLVFSSNAVFNLATTAGPACQINGAITPTGWTVDSNILLRTAVGNGWTLSDVGGTFTNNTVVGAAAIGISLTEGAAFGTISGLVAHSNVSTGIAAGAQGNTGTISSPVSWRNNGVGASIATSCYDIIFDSPVAFGNNTANFSFTASCGVSLVSPVLGGDTSFATTSGVLFSLNGGIFNARIDNGDLSTVTGIKTAHSNDINVALGSDVRAVLRNTKLGAATEVATPSNLSNNGFIASERHDGIAGNHMTWMKNGLIQTDTTIFNTLSPSQRLTPTGASLKLESAYQFQGVQAAVASGTTMTIGVYTRKSVVGDGVAYNGNQPLLVLKANPAIGILVDTLIATASVAAGTWGQITGTTPTATDDGVMEFVVQADGTAGWVNIDDWSAS